MQRLLNLKPNKNSIQNYYKELSEILEDILKNNLIGNKIDTIIDKIIEQHKEVVTRYMYYGNHNYSTFLENNQSDLFVKKFFANYQLDEEHYLKLLGACPKNKKLFWIEYCLKENLLILTPAIKQKLLEKITDGSAHNYVLDKGIFKQDEYEHSL